MRARLPLAGALTVALVLALGVGGIVLRRATHSSSTFARAVALAPAGTARVGWTECSARPTTVDLSSASALGTSAADLQATLGLSPTNLEWESFSQSPDGAALVLKVPESFSFDALADDLDSLGFGRPDEDDGTWAGGPDVLARIRADLTPELQYWTLLEDEDVVVTSDTAAYGDGGDGARVEGLDDVVDPQHEPLTGLVYTGAYACEHLAMAQADEADQSRAEEGLPGRAR